MSVCWRSAHSVAVVAVAFICVMTGIAVAEVQGGSLYLPSIFGHHMVLQRGRANPIWGWCDAGTPVKVTIAGQAHTATAGKDGRWNVSLQPLPAGGPHRLEVVAGDARRVFDDILVGEVWVCSGQSNMEWPVRVCKDPQLDIGAANCPQIRLITVPKIGTQVPQNDFSGRWEPCSPATVGDFSAVGYNFGRQLHDTLQIPIGLIDNAWGGSAAEAWVPRATLQSDPKFGPLLDSWIGKEKQGNAAQLDAEQQQRLTEWTQLARQAQAAGHQVPPPPVNGDGELFGNARPGNLFNGVLQPVIGYGIRGVIWYQGESNAGRAYQYRDLFPLMISEWRTAWQQGDFPFYWVQLADFKDERSEPEESDWAELREAQTMTMDKLSNTGEAVIIDIGEGRDIHPRNKQDVAKRLARWALARDYGIKIDYRSPTYKQMRKQDGKIVLTFDHVGEGGLYTFDVDRPRGFTIAGSDRKFVNANATLRENQIEVWADAVADPVAVRYAWANNPVCNVQSREGLPLTPFRTDDWPGVTINNGR